MFSGRQTHRDTWRSPAGLFWSETSHGSTGKQADQTDGASGGCHQGRPGRNPAPRTSARSNGTTSFSTASTSSIVPGSAKERVLMLYFNTNVGATLAPHQPRQSEQVCPTQRTLHLGHERGRASQHGGVAPEADLPETAGLPAGGSGAISAVNRRIPIATPLLTSSLGGPGACPLLFFKKLPHFSKSYQSW